MHLEQISLTSFDTAAFPKAESTESTCQWFDDELAAAFLHFDATASSGQHEPQRCTEHK